MLRSILNLIAIILTASLLAGCVMTADPMRATEAPIEDFGSSTEGPRDYSLYFPDDAPYSYLNHDAGADETVYIREIIKTNTTGIRIKNNSDMTVTCTLSYPDDLSDTILTFTLQPGKSNEFSGLTQALNYCIGVTPEESGTVDLTISG